MRTRTSDEAEFFERTVLLLPPAREALKVLIEDASPRPAVDLKVWLDRHESRIDSVRILLSAKTQAPKAMVNPWYAPSAWNTKWATLIRRAGIRTRPPYQTRHTHACWNLTARGWPLSPIRWVTATTPCW